MFRFALAHAVDLNKIGVGEHEDGRYKHEGGGLTREFRSKLVYDNPSGGGV